MADMHSSAFLPQLGKAFRGWWREHVREAGVAGAGSLLMRELWGFLRDSTSERRSQRYGDMEYDWQYRFDTTSGSVAWRERLLGTFLSAYQPTDPAAFTEMMSSLPIDFRQFTFVDLGSGKGRTLLMAAEYPFRRIVGVEILAELHRVAEENVRAHLERILEKGPQIECICADARDYEFPAEPLVLYLFNPISRAGLVQVVENLERSLHEHPREAYILYHNPLLEHVLAESAALRKKDGMPQFSIYATAE